MTESSTARARKANLPGAKGCTTKGKPFAPFCPVHRMLPLERWARQVWPLKTAHNLSLLINRSLRTGKYRLAGDFPLDLDDVVRILRSEHGFSFLQFLMADASPGWWRGVGKARRLSTMRRQLTELQRHLAQAELDLD